VEPNRAGLTLQHVCVSSGPETCFNATDDNCNGLIDEGCGVASGLVSFVIAWDEPTADVDLLVIDPNGELAEVGRATASGLIKELDCPAQSDMCRGQNVENVYLERSDVPRGRYLVRVRLETLGEAEGPIWVRLGVRLHQETVHALLEFAESGSEHELAFLLE
jgi:tRNA (guanosine-2'-O-)-methyltransferase